MTKKKAMDKIFFRFYDIPRENYLLALYGAEWKRKYGSEGESLHFPLTDMKSETEEIIIKCDAFQY